LLIGIIGKTNVGKSTFFSAATLVDVEMANRPFTTIKPNRGVAQVRTQCACKVLGIEHSGCIDGVRFIPVELLDVAGLVPDAHLGRGLGNKFLDDLRQADVFVHVVDASGSTDAEGRFVGEGARDPLEDIKFLEIEIQEWLKSILSRDWVRVCKLAEQSGAENINAIHEKLSGLGFSKRSLEVALEETGLAKKKLSTWNDQDMTAFSIALRQAKPFVVAANKADLPNSSANIERMEKEVNAPVIPVIAEAELALKRAARRGLISYTPGDSKFEITSKNIPPQLASALSRLSDLLEKFGGTGVQQTLEAAIFTAYQGIVVYPVEDMNAFSDKNGNVLPDAIIMKSGSTPVDLARMIHSDMAKGYLYSIDAKTKQRVASDYLLKDGDVIKIVFS
jgi:ribosome-binding ATPase YchF (GTP1/OBG family)